MGVFKRGNIWHIRFTYWPPGAVESQEIKWSSGETVKKQAEIYLADVERSIRDGNFEEKYLRRSPGSILLSAGIEWYLKNYVASNIAAEKNRHDIELILERFLKIIGDKPSVDVRMKDLEKYKLVRQAEVSKTSIDRALGAVSGLFSRMARYEIIDYNPVAGKIIYFNENSKRTRFASKEEIRQIFGAVNDIEFKLIILFGLMTGLRLGDICILARSHLDLDRGIIRIIPGKTRKKQRELVQPMNHFLLAVVKKYIDDYNITGRLFHLESPKVSNIWRGLILSLGITPHIQFRDLRRSFSTLLYDSPEVDIKIIKELLGHAKIDLSDEVYTVTSIDRKRNAVESLPVGFLEKYF
jgi:integrase